MITFLLVLSLYSAILSTFLFGRWVRTVIIRSQVKRKLKREMASPEWKAFLEKHPPTNPIPPQINKDEMEGEVVRGFEVELDRMESEEVEESVEEREWREEEMIKLRRGARR